MMTDAEVELIRTGQCPACRNYGFHEGPRGGAGQNLYCCNPNCKAAYMVAPRGNIAMVEYVGKAGDEHYPPKVHILVTGFPLCSFMRWQTIDNGPPPRMVPVTPDMWPPGHSWVAREDFELSTCQACKNRARS